MSFVSAIVTAAKVTSATYRIVVTAVMVYYLVKGVLDYEKRKKEAKNAATAVYRKPVDPRPPN